MPKRGAFALVMTMLAVVLLLGFRTPADIAAITVGDDRPGVTGSVGTTPGATADGATAPPSQTQAQTVTGPVVSTRWGTVQVEITVESGQLSDVTALQLPGGDQRSASISSRVEPMLRSQALSSQSAVIDGVSGATYTSVAYARSLQAALDSAGI
jgi:uncharacterized protein with FMN-binding domain